MKRKYVLFFLLGCIACLFSKPVMAQENYQESQINTLEYLLDASEDKKELLYVDSHNDEIVITIEYIPSMTRISSGTYKISKTSKGNWMVFFNITIDSKNKIISISSLNLKALNGSIISSSLTHTAAKATCDFKRKLGLITSNVTVTATISGNQIIVK